MHDTGALTLAVDRWGRAAASLVAAMIVASCAAAPPTTLQPQDPSPAPPITFATAVPPTPIPAATVAPVAAMTDEERAGMAAWLRQLNVVDSNVARTLAQTVTAYDSGDLGATYGAIGRWLDVLEQAHISAIPRPRAPAADRRRPAAGAVSPLSTTQRTSG